VSQVHAAASSSLLTDALEEGCELVEVARTRLSVHYETGRADVPVLCVCTPDAVRLPNAVVTTMLPSAPLAVRSGHLVSRDERWRVGRWWQPPRPTGRRARHPSRSSALDPLRLVGRGPGLTPTGDDELAGALVAARAVGDPRLDGWCSSTRDALLSRRTTAVSRGLLHHALDGWATPELAAYVDEACTGVTGPALARLLEVGHSSGRALADGVAHVMTARPVRWEGAA
jgi:hypothetical protein